MPLPMPRPAPVTSATGLVSASGMSDPVCDYAHPIDMSGAPPQYFVRVLDTVDHGKRRTRGW